MGGAGVGDQDVQPAEPRRDGVEGGVYGQLVGDVAGQRQGGLAAGGGHGLGGVQIAVQHRDLGPLGGEGDGDGRPDGAAAAGDRDHPAGQALLGRLAELGLLQRPVLHVEGVLVADRLEPADGLGVQQDGGPVLGDVGGDGGLGRALAHAHEAEARDRQDARQGIEGDLGAARAGVVVAGEIGLVVADVGGEGRVDVTARRGDQREALGADHVVRRGDPALGPVRQAFVVADRAGGGRGTQVEDETAGPAVAGGLGQGAAQAGQDFRRARGRGQARGLGGPLAAFGDEFLRRADGGDHALVALPGRGPEGEDAVLEQDQAFGVGVGVAGVAGRLGQGEAGHDVGDQGEALAEHLGAHCRRVRLVGEGQDGG